MFPVRLQLSANCWKQRFRFLKPKAQQHFPEFCSVVSRPMPFCFVQTVIDSDLFISTDRFESNRLFQVSTSQTGNFGNSKVRGCVIRQQTLPLIIHSYLKPLIMPKQILKFNYLRTCVSDSDL
jgi:hypothetical protein